MFVAIPFSRYIKPFNYSVNGERWTMNDDTNLFSEKVNVKRYFWILHALEAHMRKAIIYYNRRMSVITKYKMSWYDNNNIMYALHST